LPIARIQSSSTSQSGVVQLTDSTSSTSTTTAATPNSVKTSYDLANNALPKSGGTLTGQLAAKSTSTSTPSVIVSPQGAISLTVTAAGTGGGFTVTYTLSSGTTTGLYVGQLISVTGISGGTGFNISNVAITSITSSTTLVVTNSWTGSPTGPGTLTTTGVQANLQEWQTSGGTVKASVDTAGNISATTYTGSGSGLSNLNGANITAATIPQSAMVNTKTMSRLTSNVSSNTGTSANTFANIFPSGSAVYTMAADTTYAVRMFLYWSRSASTTSTTLAVKFVASSTLQTITMGSLSEASATVSTNSIGGYVTSTATPTLNVNSVIASTTTTQVAVVEGFIRSATGGTSTLTPQFASSAALTGTDYVQILAGSYIELTNLGTGAPVLPYGSTGWA